MEKAIESRKGKFWMEKEGSKKWYTIRKDEETKPSAWAIWCETQKEANIYSDSMICHSATL